MRAELATASDERISLGDGDVRRRALNCLHRRAAPRPRGERQPIDSYITSRGSVVTSSNMQ